MTGVRELMSGMVLVVLAASPAAGQTQMASVRELYAAASCEDALSALANVNGSDPATAIEAEQYALCLLAIGRQGEARARRFAESSGGSALRTRRSRGHAEDRDDLRRDAARSVAGGGSQEFAEAALYERKEHAEAVARLERVVRITDPAVNAVAGLEGPAPGG